MSDEQPVDAAADTDRAAVWAFGLGATFAVLAAVMVFGTLIKLGFPFIFGSWGMASVGRLWPMALLTTVFGAAGLLHMAATYYLAPRLTGHAPGGSLERLGPLVSAVLIALAILAVGFGFGDGRTGFESPLLGDLAILLAFAGPTLFAVRSVLGKREETIYPSLWYLVGGFLATVVAVVVANFPLTEATGSFVQTAFGRGTVLWGFVAAGGVGSAFFLVPKITGKPLFSRQLAIATFFSLLLPGMFYGLSTHLSGPVAPWAEAVGVGMRFTFLVAAVSIPVGLLLSGAGGLGALKESAPLRLVAAGTSLLSISLFVTALTAFPAVQSTLGLTTFTMGTEFLALSGSLLLAWAMALHALPKLAGRRLIDGDGPDWGYRLTLIGSVSATALLWLAGVTSGSIWRTGAETGAYANYGEGFTLTVEATSWMFQIAGLAGILFLAGQVILARTLWSTWVSGDVTATEAVVEVDA